MQAGTLLQPQPEPPTAKQHHAVILLASGLSQRLGQAKQLLLKDEQPLICHMLQVALTTQPCAVMVVIAKNQPDILAALNQCCADNARVHTVVNPVAHTGMAHSLYLGIEAINRLVSHAVDRVLIMGVDQVLLDQSHLAALLTVGNTETYVTASDYPQLDIGFMIDENREQVIGLPLVVQYELLKQWQPKLSGDKGLRSFIRALPAAQVVRMTNTDLSYDIDTPEQWVHAKQQGWLDR